MKQIVLLLGLMGFSGCTSTNEEVADLTPPHTIDMGSDLTPQTDLVNASVDLTNAADAAAAPDLLAADLVAPWCGEYLQHICPDDSPMPGCRAGLVAMARGNDPDDLHCMDPNECGATKDAACCGLQGGTSTSSLAGYCALPNRCQTTCQP